MAGDQIDKGMKAGQLAGELVLSVWYFVISSGGSIWIL